MELEFVDRYTALPFKVPAPWRACKLCAGLGFTPDDDVCPDCHGNRRRPLVTSLRQLPWRIMKALRFGWRFVAMGGGGWSRKVAFRAMWADFG